MKKEEITQQEPVFVPAKPGEKAPEGVWVPNRRERRKMKKNQVKIGNIFTAKEAMENKAFRQDLCKKLLEDLKVRAEQHLQELEKEENNNETAN